MKHLPLLEKGNVTDPALKEKWESYSFDLALFHGWAHAPDEFLTYTPFNRTVWTENEEGMPLLLKELAVVHTGVLCDSPYEWGNHGPGFVRRGGSQEQVHALVAGEVQSDLFDETEKLVLQFTTELVVQHRPTEDTLTAMSAVFSGKQIMQLTFAIGCYILNSIAANLCGLELGDDIKYNEHQDIHKQKWLMS